MFTSSEDAMSANIRLSLTTARAELERHDCRIIEAVEGAEGRAPRLLVTNGLDPAEWIDCTSRAVLVWLGY